MKFFWQTKHMESNPNFDLTMKLAIVLSINPRVVLNAYSIWASRSHYSSLEKFGVLTLSKAWYNVLYVSCDGPGSPSCKKREEERGVGVVL